MPPRAGETRNAAVVWLLPFGVLTSVSLAILIGGYRWDAARQPGAPGLWWLLTHLAGTDASGVLGNVGQVVTQILGVAISVVAIIVELAANRYTHRITGLFFRAPVNFVVMGLFVVAGVNGLWISLMFRDSFVPLAGALVTMGLTSVCLLILLPYFAYVFEFLNPMHIVARIQAEALDAVTTLPRDSVRSAAQANGHQHGAADGTEQLADVALNAMVNHDGSIAMAAVGALGELSLDYLGIKPALAPPWFQVTHAVSQNPDFVSMSPEVRDELGRERVWFEFKILRQYQAIYQSALGQSREICYLVAIHTRELAERALAEGDTRVVDLCVKFFNTYLRATVNARDVRTGYNVFNQYRLLAEATLGHPTGHFAVTIARHMKYYGQLALRADLGFVLETAAYDLCALNELAFDRNVPERGELLKVFLQVDDGGDGTAREASPSLRGVRKAQVKLATYYILHGDLPAAREVYRDLRDENPVRLASIRDELLAVTSPYFWEITDRGVNFDYIPPDRKAKLLEFFQWFGDTIPAPRASVAPAAGSLVGEAAEGTELPASG